MESGKEFVYWFADNGAAIPYGRSLTYRFAQSCYFSACLYAGVYPCSMGVMKGILIRNFRYWMSQPILDRSGILTIGYTYPNLLMAEHYNAPGSPMWCMKWFLFLALPDDHIFWDADCRPMPELEAIKVLRKADMIVGRNRGNVTAYPSGRHVPVPMGHMNEKYAKFAYSTKYGFSVQFSQETLEEMAPDSSLVFEVDGSFHVRKNVESFGVLEDTVHSVWSPCAGIRVSTVIIPMEHGHRKIHTIDSTRTCTAYDFGFAVPVSDKVFEEATDNTACVSSGDYGCKVEGGKGIVINASPNTNLVHSKTKIPGVSCRILEGVTVLETVVLEK